jgi:tripartite-type tricarboxylate transporter receptor subunit TctC
MKSNQWNKLCFMLVVISLSFLSPSPSMTAEFPTKPVTLICPWTPGGATDIFFRVLAESTKKYLGQPVIVENKPGGAGTTGPAAMMAAAKPDGYTVSQIPIAVFRYEHMMDVSYDSLKDLTYIIGLTAYTFGVVVKSDAPWKSWNEFVAYAKANPGKITYGTPGAGSTQHMTMEWFAKKNGVEWTHVPMKGTGENMPSVLGGHVTAGADSTGFAPFVESGQMRLLVTFGEQRTKKWPDIPTLKELGYGIVADSPFGIAGPKGMDSKVVKILHDAFKKGLDDPETMKSLDQLDMVYAYKGTEDYAKQAKILWEEEKILVNQLGLKASK